MAEPIKPNKIDGEEFLLICRDIKAGKRISQQELADAVAYADRLPELPKLTEALLSGWQIAMTRLNYKNQRIGRLERQLRAAKLREEAGNENS